MKIKTVALYLLLICLTLGLSSCLEEAEDQGPDPKQDFSMVIDGKPWVASPNGPHSDEAVIVDFNTTSNIIIDAFADDGSYVLLNLAVDGGVKRDSVYRTTDDDVIFQALFKLDFTSNDVYTNLTNMSGEITFSEIDPNAVTGSFNFQVERSDTSGVITAEDGVFEIIL